MNIHEIMKTMNFVTINFETAKYSPESACAIGMVKFKDGEPADTYYSLIRPPSLYIRRDFTKIHGITVKDVKNAPSFDMIWDDVRAFIGNNVLAADHLNLNVLYAVLEWYDLEKLPDTGCLCTDLLMLKTWPNINSYSRTNLKSHFGIIYEAHYHNALDGALYCGEIVLKAAEKFGNANIKELLAANQFHYM